MKGKAHTLSERIGVVRRSRSKPVWWKQCDRDVEAVVAKEAGHVSGAIQRLLPDAGHEHIEQEKTLKEKKNEKR